MKAEGIVVVGGGPAGLRAALELRREGWDTTLIEEHSEIGKPVQCAGLVSKSGLGRLGIKPESSIVNEVKGARIFSPSGIKLEVERKSGVAYVVDRAEFDKELYKQAVSKGVDVMLSTQLIDVRNDVLFIKHGKRGEMLKGKIVVGADGVNSKVRGIMGIKAAPEMFVKAYQIRAKGSFDRDFVELHFGEFAKGFFAWVIPESKEIARIGLGTTQTKNPKDLLNEFMLERKIEASAVSRSAGLIPVGPPLKSAVRENVLLVGDAAFHTKSTTGGGLVTGNMAALALSRTVTEHYKNKTPLSLYNANLSEVNKELEIHWKLRRYMNSLSGSAMDNLFGKLKKAKAEEYLSREGDMDIVSKFLPKLLRTPSLWGVAMRLALK